MGRETINIKIKKGLLRFLLFILIAGQFFIAPPAVALGETWTWKSPSSIEYTYFPPRSSTSSTTIYTRSMSAAVTKENSDPLGVSPESVMRFDAPEAQPGVANRFSLFVSSEDTSKGLYVTGEGAGVNRTPVFIIGDAAIEVSDDPYISGVTYFEGEARGGFSIDLTQVDSNGKTILTWGIQGDNDPIATTAGKNGGDSGEGGLFRSQPNLPPGTYLIKIEEPVQGFWEKASKMIGKSMIPVVGWAIILKDKADTEIKGEDYFVGSAVVTVKAGEKPAYQRIDVERVKISPLSKALASAIGTLGSWVQASLKWVMGMVKDLLESTADYVVGRTDCDGAECGMIGPWTAMRNIGLSLLVMALIIIAFANVLQVDIEQYGMNRMIPKIIVSIFLAFTSWIIVVFFFDFSKAIQYQAIALLDTGGGGGYGGLNFMQSLSISTPSAGNVVANSGAIILLLGILGGTLVCGVILLFTLVMRIVMLSFLLAVAPLAFILNIVPFTSKLYKQWWDEFFKWMFMGPIAMVIISLGAVIAASATGSGGGFGDTTTLDSSMASGDSGGRLLIGLVIFAASMYMGATLPKQWGGSIMKGFSGVGKKIWGKTGGAAGKAAWGATGGRAVGMGKTFLGSRAGIQAARDKAIVGKFQADQAKKGGLAGWAATGVTGREQEVQAHNLHMSSVAAAASLKGTAAMDKKQLDDMIDDPNTNPYEREAAVTQLVTMGGLLGSDNHKYDAQKLFDQYAPGNGTLQGAAVKEQRELLLNSSNESMAEAGIAKNRGTELKELGGAEIKQLGLNAALVGDDKLTKRKREAAITKLNSINSEQIKRASEQGSADKHLTSLVKGGGVEHLQPEARQRLHAELIRNGLPGLSASNEQQAQAETENAAHVSSGPQTPSSSAAFTPGGYHGEGEED